jgi:hypothetical protein
MRGPRNPVSTYRLQFNQHLRFNDARALVPYLHDLGITDIYASPLLQAKRGSMHGYDVADPSHLNPELGQEVILDSGASLRTRRAASSPFSFGRPMSSRIRSGCSLPLAGRLLNHLTLRQ